METFFSRHVQGFFPIDRGVFTWCYLLLYFDVNTRYTTIQYNFIYIKVQHYSILQHNSFFSYKSYKYSYLIFNPQHNILNWNCQIKEFFSVIQIRNSIGSSIIITLIIPDAFYSLILKALSLFNTYHNGKRKKNEKLKLVNHLLNTFQT